MPDMLEATLFNMDEKGHNRPVALNKRLSTAALLLPNYLQPNCICVSADFIMTT